MRMIVTSGWGALRTSANVLNGAPHISCLLGLIQKVGIKVIEVRIALI